MHKTVFEIIIESKEALDTNRIGQMIHFLLAPEVAT